MKLKKMAGLFALLALFGAGAAHAQPVKVRVDEIRVVGNTLLPQASIDALLERYKGERSADEIKQAAAAVQALYRDAGYGAVVAFVPEQALGSGRLQITVLEGRVSRVTVSGNSQFSADNVRRSVPALQEGRTPRIQAIDAQVQLANENPARRVALTLEEGETQGDVAARLTVTEEPVQRLGLTLDNTGNAQTGRLRLGASYQHAALWDLDHQFTAQWQTSPQHPSAVRVISLGYRMPVYAAGLMLQGYATFSNIDAGSTATAAGALQFNGRGRVIGLQATRLFERLGEFEQRLSFGLDQREYLNNCAIAGLPAGACGSAGESVTVQPLTLEYTAQRSGDRPLGVTAAYSTNLGLGGNHGSAADFEAVRQGAERHYSVLRLTGYAAMPIGGDWRMNFRLAAQYTADALVPAEQFGLAGSTAVRGYEEREVTGDTGALAGVELLLPAFFAPQPGSAAAGFGGLRLLAFADAGVVGNRKGLTCSAAETHCHLASFGLGLRFAVAGSQWRFDLARAQNNARQTQSHDVKLHFSGSLAFP
jgi:hemolysin activation/secretion protein